MDSLVINESISWFPSFSPSLPPSFLSFLPPFQVRFSGASLRSLCLFQSDKSHSPALPQLLLSVPCAGWAETWASPPGKWKQSLQLFSPQSPCRCGDAVRFLEDFLLGVLSLILDLLAICWGCGGSVLMPNPLLPIPELLETTVSPARDSILPAVQRRQNRVLPHGQVRETPVMHGCQLLGWQNWI